MDADAKKVSDWLKAQPQNSVIEWSDDSISEEHPWTYSWLDVVVPDMNDALRWNWSWVITMCLDPEDEPYDLDIVVEPDLDVHLVSDPDEHWFIDEAVTPHGNGLADVDEARLSKLISEKPTRTRSIQDGISIAKVSKALEAWTAKFAERPDIKFLWNPKLGPSGPAKLAADALEQYKRGETEEFMSFDDLFEKDDD